jgi:alkylation response protein AidB-like acyl-CoA dehydrogenase
MSNPDRITSPEDQSLDALCRALAERAGALDTQETWPHAQLAICAKLGVFEWFLPQEWGGQEWSDKDIVRAYLRLSAACLTTTFVITQLTGAGRPDLSGLAQQLDEELGRARVALLAAAGGDPTLSNEQLRVRANELALRSSQAALAAAKGAGYVHGHPAGRWCREALFFLVWSCPQSVMSAHLCALAGMED